MAADPVFSNLTYAGVGYAEVFGPTVLDPADLIDNDLALPLDNTKFKITLNEYDDTVVFQNASSSFNDQSTDGDVDEVNIETIPYEFHKELKWDDIRKSWQQNQLRPGSLEDYSPSTITDDFIRKVYVPKIKLAQAHLVLNGKTGLASDIGQYTFSQTYNGLYALFNSSSTIGKLSLQADQLTVASVVKGTTTVLVVAGDHTNKIFPGNKISVRLAAGTGWTAINTDLKVLSVAAVSTNTNIEVQIDTDALTSANYTTGSARIRFINRYNIIKVLANHMAFVPEAVWRNGEGAKIVIPTHLRLEWQFANAEAQQNGGNYYLSAYQQQMIDQQIVVLDSAPANTVGTWDKNRVGYGFDLSTDYSNVKVVWMGETTNDMVYRLRAGMKTGVGISKKFANQITLTTPEK